MNTNLETSAAGNGAPSSAEAPVETAPSEAAGTEIIPAYLRALEPVYYAAMMEEAGLFEVVDRLVTLFAQGLLPLGPGRAGAVLYKFWRRNCERLTEEERHTVYARAFGMPCDGIDVVANTKFNDLWVQFVSIVGMYSAELQVLPPSERSVGPAEILTIGRDLAINVSAHGRGLAWFAAHDFKPEMPQIMELLSDRELQKAFGASDPWQLVAAVAASELGIRPNVLRGRMRAETGTIIIRWLSNRRTRLLRPRSANILRDEDICEGRTAASLNKRVSVYPTDADLVTACEQWLAATGTKERMLKDEVKPEAPPPTVRAAVERARSSESSPASPTSAAPAEPVEQPRQAA